RPGGDVPRPRPPLRRRRGGRPAAVVPPPPQSFPPSPRSSPPALSRRAPTHSRRARTHNRRAPRLQPWPARFPGARARMGDPSGRQVCWSAYVRAAYHRAADLQDLLEMAEDLSAKTMIVDVEPLVARWDNGQDALDRGVDAVLAEAAAVKGAAVVCFATNSARRPSMVPSRPGLRVVYLASARKPLLTPLYGGFPRPGVVIGDQVATDGVLARRLGYAFLQYWPPLSGTPWGPRLLSYFGRAMRPLLFTRPA